MYLKRITIQGFKSFADKVVLSLDKGISGVVGPNGSGKSNIIDAVRWVMGEQNAKNLRGEKSTDIIFAGSDKRKAMSVAEVSLTFDNTEDQGLCPPEFRHEPELTITRRLFLDGEREYLINKKECRLKDVLQFFTLAGIGGRSYTMIQQGQVDRILNAKAEDVREILEEAAGTLVYKDRKNEALKRLDDTNLNLSRVTDILKEIDQQISHLGEQVTRVQEFQKLQGELRDLEITTFAHNYHFFVSKLSDLDQKTAVETTVEVDILTVLSSFESRKQELELAIDECQPEINNLQEDFSQTREEIARFEAVHSNSFQKVDQFKKRLSGLSQEIQEELKLLEAQEQEEKEKIQSLATAEKNVLAYRESLESFVEEAAVREESFQVLQRNMEDLEDDQKHVLRMIESQTIRINALHKDLERVVQQQDLELKNQERLKEDQLQAEGGVKEADSKVASMKSSLDSTIHTKHEHEAKIAQYYQDLKKLNASRDKHKEDYHTKAARLASLEEIASTTGLLEELRKLTAEDESYQKWLDRCFCLHLTFDDKIAELPRRAVAAFERWSERLIVKDLPELKELQTLAQKANLGVIPVSSSFLKEEGKKIEEWAKRWDIIPLSHFVQISKVQSWMKEVLSRLYFSFGLEVEKQALLEKPASVVLFAASGTIFEALLDFSVHFQSGGGLLTRKTEADQLRVVIKELEANLAREQATVDETEAQIQYSRQALGDIDSHLTQNNREVLEVLAALQASKQNLEHKGQLLEMAQTTVQELALKKESLEQSLKELELNTKTLQKDRAKTEEHIAELKSELAACAEERNAYQSKKQSLEIDIVKTEGKIQALKEDLHRLRVQLELGQSKLSRRYGEQNQLQDDIEKIEEEHRNFEGRMESLILRREELSQLISQKRFHFDSLQEELVVIDGKLKEAREKQQKTQKLITERQMERERIKILLASLVQQAQEKHSINLENYQGELHPEFDLDRNNKAVAQVRAKIEQFGAVNMLAMKEHDDLTERRGFISNQQSEIEKSMEVLRTAIQEIELTSKERFLEVFKTVNLEFIKLFPILFPGGEARLEITAPDDPLAGGVEILVRLPGKKLQSMTLFSGGEKALTAISLIFALLKTKPSPFCFLDEVDAPLDEANVGRFNRVVEALSGEFQFVVITHNRRTMEVLDTLYGVTMQEGGVSTVVGVDMKKDLPEHLKKAFTASPSREVVGASAQ